MAHRRLIIQEYEPMIGHEFADRSGRIWRFFGLVWGYDDFYYGMISNGEVMLATCVGSLEQLGYTPARERSSGHNGDGE